MLENIINVIMSHLISLSIVTLSNAAQYFELLPGK